MELIQVGDNKLKIMLTLADMDRYEISEEIMEMSNAHVRSAFREILKEARMKTGFNTTGNRLYIQYYPSRDGGCELFVTKLGKLLPADDDTTSDVESLFTPQKKQRNVLPAERVKAYTFPSVSALLSACHRLFPVTHENGDSSAWQDEDGTVYLFLYDWDLHPGNDYCRPERFLLEYGTPQDTASLLLYISEHGKPICESRAVETLAVI